jgi:signal transduction histidine kinase
MKNPLIERQYPFYPEPESASLDELFLALHDVEELCTSGEGVDAGFDRRVAEWHKMLEISARIAGELDPDALLKAVLETAIEITNAERGLIILVDESGQPNVEIAHNLKSEEIRKLQDAIGDCVFEKVLFERQPLFLEDTQNSDLLAEKVKTGELDVKAFMAAPFICHNQLLGMAYVDHCYHTAVFNVREFSFFVTFVNLAAVAFDNAVLFRSLSRSNDRYRELQEYHENILSTVPTAILVLNERCRLEYANQAAERIFPWIKNLPFRAHFKVPFERIQNGLEEMRQGFKPPGITQEINGRIYEVNFFDISARERKIGILLTDVTDGKRLEQQYFELEKRALITQLAGGIAHEISNHLFPIQGRAQLLSLKLQRSGAAPDEEIMKSLQTIENQVQRITRIVENLRNLSKPVKSKFSRTDVNQILSHAVEIMHSTAGRIKQFSRQADGRFRLNIQIADQPLPVRGDADQLLQAFMNLIINAAHALEDVGKGTLTLESRREADTAVVSIADDGPGIPEELRHKIFEPYFTTKGEGKGTGLGLTIVRDIIKAHQGELRLETETGVGTRFEIRLPLMLSA